MEHGMPPEPLSVGGMRPKKSGRSRAIWPVRPGLCWAAPSGADHGVHRLEDARGIVRQRCDGITQSVARDVRDLKRIKDDGTTVDYEVRPEMAVAPAELSHSQQRNDHASREIAKPV